MGYALVQSLVLLTLLWTAQQKATQPPPALERPQATSLDAWLAQVKARLSVSARLTQSWVTEGFYPNRQSYRVYKAQVEIENRSGYLLQTGKDSILIETSRPPADAGPQQHPFELTMGGSIKAAFVVEDYSGAIERLDDEDPPGELLGLSNVQAPHRSGMMRGHHGDLYRIGTLPSDWPGSLKDYGQAVPGQNLSLDIKYVLIAIVKPERLDQVAFVSPVLELRDKQRSVRFRYALLFSRIGPEDKEKKKVAWKLAEAKLIALTAESLLPMASDTSLPLWRRVLAADWVGEHGGEAAEPVLVNLATAKGKENDRLRMTALGALGRTKQESTMPKVLAIVKDDSEHPLVRVYAILALGRLGDPRATQPLLSIVKGKVDHEITEAISALGVLGDKTAAETLLALLEDSKREHYHRRAAGVALARLADSQHLDRLTRLTKSSDLITRLAANKALAGIGTQEALAVLIELSRKSTEAIDALGKVDQPAALAALQARLTGAEEAPYNVVDAIAALDTPERAAALREALGSPKRWDAAAKIGLLRVTSAASALPPLLKDPEREVRASAAEALGRLKARTAIEPLVATLQDKETSVRRAAARALGWIGATTAVEPLGAMLKDKETTARSGAAEALGLIRSPQSVNLLVVALGDADKDVRYAVTESLGKLKYAKSVEALIPLLGDKVDGVAERAWEGLYQITGEDFGNRPDAWQKWWSENKPRLPSR